MVKAFWRRLGSIFLYQLFVSISFLFLPQLVYGYKTNHLVPSVYNNSYKSSQSFSNTQLSGLQECNLIREGLGIPEASLEKEFLYLAEQLHLQAKKLKNLPFTSEELGRTLQRTFVMGLPKNKVMIKGEIVDAINEPEKNLIIVNQDSWARKNILEKIELVLHELLGMMKVEKNVYGKSLVAQPLINATYTYLVDLGVYAIYPFTVIVRHGNFYICKANKTQAFILRYRIAGDIDQFAEAFTSMVYIGATEDDPFNESLAEISIGHPRYLRFRNEMIPLIRKTFDVYERQGHSFIISALLTERLLCPSLKKLEQLKAITCYLDFTEAEILIFENILKTK